MPLQYQKSLRLLHPEGHCDAITAVTFSPNGCLLTSGSLDGRVCVWHVSSGKLLYVFSGKSAVLSVIWLDSDERMMCGMEDGTVASLSLIRVDGFLTHHFPVERLAFNGTYLASGVHKQVKVWSRTSSGTWVLVAALRAPRRSSYTTVCDIMVTSLHWTSNSLYPLVLLVTYMNHGVVAFDGHTWTPLPGYMQKQPLMLDGEVFALAIAAHYDDHHDDFYVATGIFNWGSPSSIILWKTQETRMHLTFMLFVRLLISL
ncbi:WD40-repeat-containing domain protein [Trametes meyenii]|nr:WD40-repeat-containing domain protein [Trametes meyenii]